MPNILWERGWKSPLLDKRKSSISQFYPSSVIRVRKSALMSSCLWTQENINYLRARNRNENDTVIAAVNLLLKDSATYVKEKKAKDEGKQDSIENGKNILVLLYQYLNVQKDTSMVSFSQQDWNILATQIKSSLHELTLDTPDQKISYYREKTEALKKVYDNLVDNKKVTALRSDIMITSYYQRLENAIKGLRRLLHQKEGL